MSNDAVNSPNLSCWREQG